MIASPTVPVATVTANSLPLCTAGALAGVSASGSTGQQSLTFPAGWGLFCVTNHSNTPTNSSYGIGYELA
jgi:Tfp pilus assembly protein PilV